VQEAEEEEVAVVVGVVLVKEVVAHQVKEELQFPLEQMEVRVVEALEVVVDIQMVTVEVLELVGQRGLFTFRGISHKSLNNLLLLLDGFDQQTNYASVRD
jgi:hypothetical protein